MNNNKKQVVSILGSTGSIGNNTIDVISKNINKFSVYALTAKNNVKLLAKQSFLIKPNVVAIQNKDKYKTLKDELFGKKIKIYAGDDGIIEVTKKKVDTVVASIVGIAGLKPTINSIPNCLKLCLANKECLVASGKLFIDRIKRYKCKLIPLDSEHNAIFQLCHSNSLNSVDSITLTASGGPFRKYGLNQLKNAKLKEALRHPNWKMGKKITIDSATLMNKAFEFIEAYYLFNLNVKQINVVIHPESIIHSLVSYIDGSTTALLSAHDMRIPISYSLNWPKRTNYIINQIDLIKLKELSFEKPNKYLKQSLDLAKFVLNKGGAYPLIMNAANEVAVSFFLQNKIQFLDIIKTVKYIVSNSTNTKINNIEDVYKVNELAKYQTNNYILKRNGLIH